MNTIEEVLEFVEEEDVKFIKLAFFDIFGHQKNISIPPEELYKAFKEGISFDGSAVTGFNDEVKSDLFLHPDPKTVRVLPWRSLNGLVISMYCDIRYPDETPYEKDSRYILKQAIERAKRLGITVDFGTEYEFYLFKLDEQGNNTNIPLDRAGYMDIAPDDQGEDVRKEICMTLRDMNIQPEASHHEEGPGQNEIDFRYSHALEAAE
ncbi:MAG: glutamine synthetase beta-grasp domain-containing protein, partial [Holdemanella sp.]|nr:glutamine synthetase beta-grasp domain-containing protein [Holdemanella sp.]